MLVDELTNLRPEIHTWLQHVSTMFQRFFFFKGRSSVVIDTKVAPQFSIFVL